jgi:hypothetical protein
MLPMTEFPLWAVGDVVVTAYRTRSVRGFSFLSLTKSTEVLIDE